MRIAVCDDEPVQVEGNAKLIDRWASARGIAVNMDTFSGAEEFLLRRSEKHVYDLAVLDIKMNEMTGIELAKRLRETDSVMQIIFVTAFPEYAPQGYDVSALNYLIKPYKPQELFKALDRAYDFFKRKESEALVLSDEGRIMRIPYYEILYCEIKGHYFTIYTLSMGQFQVKMKMDELLSVLDRNLFVRCHRSYIINIACAAVVTRFDIKLKNGETIPLSRSHIQPVRALFLEYHKFEQRCNN